MASTNTDLPTDVTVINLQSALENPFDKLLWHLNCMSKKIKVLWGVPPALNIQFKCATAYLLPLPQALYQIHFSFFVAFVVRTLVLLVRSKDFSPY